MADLTINEKVLFKSVKINSDLQDVGLDLSGNDSADLLTEFNHLKM